MHVGESVLLEKCVTKNIVLTRRMREQERYLFRLWNTYKYLQVRRKDLEVLSRLEMGVLRRNWIDLGKQQKGRLKVEWLLLSSVEKAHHALNELLDVLGELGLE